MKRSRAPSITENDGLLMMLQHVPPFPAAVAVVARLRQVNRRLSANGPFWFRVQGRWQFGSNAADQMPVMRSLMAHCKTDALLRALGYRGRIDLLTNIKPELGRNSKMREASKGAARGGQLDTVRWCLGGNSYPWDEDIIVIAAYFGHKHILKWFADAGYPKPSRAYHAAENAERPDVFECLKELGYTLPTLDYALVDNMHPGQYGT